jgi:nucleoside-diphosphate-sugar epimerase
MSFTRPVLVTGATGFIGRRLVARLLEEGAAVRALVLEGDPGEVHLPKNLPKGSIEIARGSVSDPRAATRAAQGTEVVFHLAAVVGDWAPEELFRTVTIEGTRNVLSAAAEAGARAVLASSIVVYGDAIGRAECAEDRPFGEAAGAYSRSKQEQERIAADLGRRAGLAVTTLRLANVFGPGSRPWVEMAIDQLKSGAPALIGRGDQNAGLCYVDNAAEALVRAALTPSSAGRAYNVNDASDVTWRRYFEDLARAAGTRPPSSLPLPAAKIAARACEGVWSVLRLKGRPPVTREALNLVSSHHRIPIDRARRELGFEPKVGYEEGMARVRESLKKA